METNTIRSYRKTLRRFQRILAIQMGNCCGVTLAQCLVLLEIDEHGHQTMGQLAANLRLDQSTLSRTVDGLVRKKLVARLRDDSDRRLVWIRLTQKGASICEDIHRGNDSYCIEVLNNIPESKRTEVIRNFEILTQAYLDHEASTS